jgi:site-specific DNA-cytosine methylase
MRDFDCVDFFCGAGLASKGIERAGARNFIGIDTNEDALTAYRYNLRNSVTLRQDISLYKRVSYEVRKLMSDKLQVFWFSPECKSFSGVRVKSHEKGKSTILAYSIPKIVAELLPSAFIIENVPAFFSAKTLLFDSSEIKTAIESVGYRWQYFAINASDYGGSSSRKRGYAVCTNPALFNAVRKPELSEKSSSSWRPDYSEGGQLWQNVKDTNFLKLKNSIGIGLKKYAGENFLVCLTGITPKIYDTERVLPCITTKLDRLFMVRPAGDDIFFRKLTEFEQAKAMDAENLTFAGNKEERLKQIGNGVNPTISELLINQIKKSWKEF